METRNNVKINKISTKNNKELYFICMLDAMRQEKFQIINMRMQAV